MAATHEEGGDLVVTSGNMVVKLTGVNMAHMRADDFILI
jgi:hypothetical protein